jgi:hypothetical protein
MADKAKALISLKPISLKHSDRPETFIKPKRVHPRRVLPFIREGKERAFHSTSSRSAIARAQAMPALAAADEIMIVTNTELGAVAQQMTSANVNEPSTVINGDVVFFTGNWYAASSQDGGKTFRFIDPKTTAQTGDPQDQVFCCDQVVNYISQIDTFVWLLQYGPEAGNNVQRLAFAKTADVGAGKWRFFDLTTGVISQAGQNIQGAFLDFPDLAVGTNFLYVTTNIFLGQQAGSAVVRIPIAGIDAGQVTAEAFVRMDLQSFRVAQNCGTTAFFAAHQDTSTLAVFSWPENADSPIPNAVGVARWIGNNGYQSRTPDGRRWLDRADPRITGATLAGDELWFAWSVDTGSNHRPKPFVQIARINAPDLTLIENVNVFDSEAAIAYAALATNANNEVGISYAIGGGSHFPSHVVGILTGNRKDMLVTAGDRSSLPDEQTGKFEWGDFLTVRPFFPDQQLFAATGYVLKGQNDGQNRDATPHFVIFGRAGTTVGHGPSPGPAPTPVVTTGPGVVTPAPVTVGDGPIADVDSLPVVAPDVGAAIKAACIAAGQAVMAFAAPLEPRRVTKPGVERWPVKTGTDDDIALVGKNVFAGKNFGAGIVEATVEELVALPRIPDMSDVTSLNHAFQSKRAIPLELVIWRINATIIELKLEADGDYHLVLQGASGETMIGEVPTPTAKFIGDSPWMQNIQAARQAVDDKLLHHVSPADFVLSPKGMLVPRNSFPYSLAPRASFSLPESFKTPPEGKETMMPTFKTQIPSTPATITGVGFFDKVHGQDGVSQSNGIELHAILKIVFL